MFTRALAFTVLGAVALSVVPNVASSHTADLGFAIEQARMSYRDACYRRNHVAFGYASEYRRLDHGRWAGCPVIRGRSQ